MKKIAIGIAALVCVVGMVYGATLQTAGNQEKSKMGNSTLVDIVNANDVALNSELGKAVTNATAATVITPKPGATVTATAVNTPQTATITVTITPQTVDVTNAAGTVSAVWTNATASFTGMTNATIAVTVANGAGLLTNATAVTTMTLERR